MPKTAKKRTGALAKVDRLKNYGLDEALSLVKETSYAKFDETVDVAVRLGVDPRHADQMVRGAVVLPNGLGKDVRVLVFAKGEKEREAREAGADYVGAEDLVAKIQEGWFDFDTAIATPGEAKAVASRTVLMQDRIRIRLVEWLVADLLYQQKFGEDRSLDDLRREPGIQGRYLFHAQQLVAQIRLWFEDAVHPVQLRDAHLQRSAFEVARELARVNRDKEGA